jgi:dopamine beta-monooxygenase
MVISIIIMKFHQTTALSLLLLLPSIIQAYPTFRTLIPNGFTVPNPDIPGTVWSGVGHLAVGGGGPRNPFGLDFAAEGFEWTVALCQKDSDGDGRTNGEELGDPNCEWLEGDDPAFPAQSHPGIVDTVAETPNSDTCADYDPPADTQTLDIAFSSPNNLDGSRTEYLCEQFRVSSPDTSTSYYHQIKSDPLVDNEDVLHHMFIYSCDGITSSDGNKVGQGSYSCSGIEGNCQIVAGWALGQPELCEPPNVGSGVAFGALSGDAVFKVEAHYDNTYNKVTTDQSGMRLHLTKELRPLEAGQVILGMDYWDRQFELEPARSLVSRSNICPTEATMRLPHPIYFYIWNPHMHLHGRSLITEHYRCGEKIGEIGNIPNFEFDNQQSYVLETPIKVLPGDALVTTCNFDTSSSSEPIIGGEQTTEEMCGNYLSYYPSLWTPQEPNLFTVCVAFEQGIRPELVGYNDFSSFVSLDLGGDLFIEGHDSVPANNWASCCDAGGAANCEQQYLASANDACAVDDDCAAGLFCNSGLCKNGGLSGDDEDGLNHNNTNGSSGDTDTSEGKLESSAFQRVTAAITCIDIVIGVYLFAMV